MKSQQTLKLYVFIKQFVSNNIFMGESWEMSESQTLFYCWVQTESKSVFFCSDIDSRVFGHGSALPTHFPYRSEHLGTKCKEGLCLLITVSSALRWHLKALPGKIAAPPPWPPFCNIKLCIPARLHLSLAHSLPKWQCFWPSNGSHFLSTQQ